MKRIRYAEDESADGGGWGWMGGGGGGWVGVQENGVMRGNKGEDR